MKTDEQWKQGSLQTDAAPAEDIQQSNRKMYNIALAAALAATVLLMLWIHNLPYSPYSTGSDEDAVTYEIAKVLEVTEETLTSSAYQEGLAIGSQTLLVELLSGERKGETVTAQNSLSTYSSVVGTVGRKLVVTVDETASENYQVWVYKAYRTPMIYCIAGLFFAALVLVGGRKGLMSALGLLYTLFCVVAVFLPLVLRGYSPVLSAVLLAGMISAVSMLLLCGISRKSLCCVLGTVFGVVLSALIMMGISAVMDISGYSTDEAESLLLISQTSGLQVRDLLYAGILIASLGAIMDIAMSVASSMSEVLRHFPNASGRTLFRAGMNVGKDVIGTMSNTLILVFVGTSLNLLILLSSYSVQYNQWMNMDAVAVEIAQAFSGSLAIVLTVPMTAAVAARLLRKENAQPALKKAITATETSG